MEEESEHQGHSSGEVDPGEIDMLISQKEDELNQINRLRIATLEKIIADKTRTVEQLQARLSEASQQKSEVDSLRANLEELAAKLEKAKKKVTDKDMEISELRTQLDTAHQKLSEQRGKATAAEESVMQIERRVGTDLSDIRRQYEEDLKYRLERNPANRNAEQAHAEEKSKLEALLRDRDDEIKKLREGLDSTGNAIMAETQKKEETGSALAEVQQKLEEKARQCEELAEQLDAANADREAAVQRSAQLEAETRSTEGSCKDAVANFEKLVGVKNDSILQLEAELQATKEELSLEKRKHEKEVRGLDTALKELQGKTQVVQQNADRELTSAIEAKEAEKSSMIRDYEGKIRRLEQELMLARNDRKNKEGLWGEEVARCKEMAQRAEADKAQVEQLLDLERKKADEERRDEEKNMTLLAAKRDGLVEEVKFYKSKLDARTKELEEVRKKAAESERRGLALQRDVADLRNSHESQLSTLKKETQLQSEPAIRELKAQVEALTREAQQCKDAEGKAKEALRQREAENEKLASENESLKRKEGLVHSVKSIDLQNVRRYRDYDTGKDSIEDLRDDFNRNMQMIDESGVKAKVQHDDLTIG